MKKKNGNAITNPAFIKSVDKPLRKLVKWLHRKGIKTTPSCSGHHISERNLEMIYEELEKDRDEVRGGRLELRDIQTGKTYFLHDKNYILPWEKRDFLEQVSAYQQKGIIGLHFGNRKKAKEQIRKMHIEGVTIEERGPLILILINEGNRGDNVRTWEKITRKVIGILD